MKGYSDTVYQVNIEVLHFCVLPKIEDLQKNIFVNDSRGHVERCGNTFVELIFAKSTKNGKFTKCSISKITRFMVAKTTWKMYLCGYNNCTKMSSKSLILNGFVYIHVSL